MTQAELIERVSAQTGMPPDPTGHAVDAALAVITRVLENGGEVVLPGFGKFSVTERKPGRRMNAATGLAAGGSRLRRPRFGAARPLKKRLNEEVVTGHSEQAQDAHGAFVFRRGPTIASSPPRSYSLTPAANSPRTGASLVVVNKRTSSSRSFAYRPEGPDRRR